MSSKKKYEPEPFDFQATVFGDDDATIDFIGVELIDGEFGAFTEEAKRCRDEGKDEMGNANPFQYCVGAFDAVVTGYYDEYKGCGFLDVAIDPALLQPDSSSVVFTCPSVLMEAKAKLVKEFEDSDVTNSGCGQSTIIESGSKVIVTTFVECPTMYQIKCCDA